MKTTSLFRRILSVALVIAMLGSFLVPIASAEPGKAARTEELTLTPIDPGELASEKLGQTETDDTIKQEDHALTDVVRVSIVLKKASTLDAGFSPEGIADNAAAMSYRKGLRADQSAVTARIEKAVGSKLDVKWNLTLAANIISANVLYGQIETIKRIDGVQDVFMENRYEPQKGETSDEPNNGSACYMIGSNLTLANGYSGAGSRIAVIDTGADALHQSFAGEGLEYALAQNAEEKGLTYEAYVESLDLLTAEKIDAVADQLNSGVTGEKAYVNTKIGYGYNYVDKSFDILHENDTQGEHGSHVSGIATANRFIKVGEEFKPALEAVGTQGVAPDAQLVVMKVFGKNGGAYDSDYMSAIEDAIVLGCDAANLSLGSGAAGFGFSDAYEAIMNKLVENGMVVAFSAGNSYGWYDTPYNPNMYPYLYIDDVNYDTTGSPGSYTNALTVASVNNAGQTGWPMIFGDKHAFFTETSGYGNEPLATLAGKEYEYVFVNGPGVDDNAHVGAEGDQFFALGEDVVKGKIAICFRGKSSFFAKANAAAAQGAVGVIIVNNEPGAISMNLQGYSYKAPVVSILQSDGYAILEQSTEVTDANENVYYTGTVSISEDLEILVPEISDTVEISAFSSWGIPGTMVLKPEILAPGGSIYSVNGLNAGGGGHDQYEIMSGTSMASPQVAGMAAVLGQYIRDNDLVKKTGLTARQLINSLLMSTAHPVYDSNGNYWPVIRVGAGLANVADATNAMSYILMDEDATLFPDSARDGKVKVELGDDPDAKGEYTYSFTYYPLEGQREFTLRTDIFTQGIAGDIGYGMLQNTGTMLIGSETTYEIEGTVYEDTYLLDADVNKDEVTDEKDAQAILDYLTGAAEDGAPFDAQVADVDKDGKITSYDAKLILDSAATPIVEISKPTKVTVHIKLDEEWKEELLYYFTKGFYVQGYTYVDPIADEEGVMDVVHSIPIMGFCGSWTGPSMFDRSSPIDEAYGTGRLTYLNNPEINYLSMKSPDGVPYTYMGNPYVIEDEFPADRLAMNSAATLQGFNYSNIRNAATLGFAVQDKDGKVLGAMSSETYKYSAFYYVNGGAWMYTNPSVFAINKKLSAFGLKEGDKATVGFYALPEYSAIQYAKMNNKVATSGSLDSEGFKTMLEAGLISDGASIGYDVTIDNTAPVVKGAFRDLITGKITVMVSDNEYIAYVGLLNRNGTKEYLGIVPEQSEPGEYVEVPLELDSLRLPGVVTLLVGDYAGNEVAFAIDLNANEEEDLGGLMLAFTGGIMEPGTGNRALQIDAETLNYARQYNPDTMNYEYVIDGLEVYENTQKAVTAAEYVEGYVFMACEDGCLYAADINALDDPELVGSFSETTATIYDMAFNYRDNTLYAIGEDNVLYEVNVVTGELTVVATITITNPVTNHPSDPTVLLLRDLAIDDDNNFYLVNGGSSTYVYLYKFAKKDIVNGRVDRLNPVNNDIQRGKLGIYNTQPGGSMAWDHNTGELYVISNYEVSSFDNALWIVNTRTGKATRANSAGSSFTSACLMNSCNGLIIVPGKSHLLDPTDIATAITVEPEEMNLLCGQTAVAVATVFPWTLMDKSVTWESADPAIAEVHDGEITGVSVGETTVTVTTNSRPNLSAEIKVTVEELPDAELRGIIWDEEGNGMASVFHANAPADWEGVQKVGNFVSATVVGETVYAFTEDTMYAFDADTYEVIELGGIDSSWVPSDAAELPADLAESMGITVKLLGVCGYGTVLDMLDPEAGTVYYWELTEFADDPLTAIALAGRTDFYSEEEDEYFEDCALYDAMTESGKLWHFYMTPGGNLFYEEYGSTGIALEGASDVTGDNKASMVYDEQTDFLYLASYDGNGEIAVLYAIDANDPAKNALVGDFGAGVWPVVGLYEYDALTDLALKVTPTEIVTYESLKTEVNIKIKLGQTNTYTAEVADPDIVSFEDGVITALKEGQTTVTITTDDTNKEGEHLSKTINVFVIAKTSLDLTVKGQVTDENGARFTNILLDGPVAGSAGPAAPFNVCSGARTGNIYMAATIEDDVPGIVALDPETFEPVEHIFNNLYSYFPAMDIANYPAFINASGETVEHYALFTVRGGLLASSEYAYWDLSSYVPDMAGIAFSGVVWLSEDTGVYVYYMLSSSGMLYEVDVYYANNGLNINPVFDTGITVEDENNLSMAYVETVNLHGDSELDLGENGLVIANNEDQNLWYIDFLTGKLCLIGTLDSTNVSGLIGSFDDLATVAAESLPEGYTAAKLQVNAANRIGDGMAAAASAAHVNYEGATVQASKLGETVNAAVGSTNAIKGTVNPNPLALTEKSAADNGKVSIELTEEKAVTNGLITVEYDPQVLTFVDGVSTLLYKSINEKDGVITFAYASADEIPAETVLATLNFTYEDKTVDTTITVKTLERGDNVAVNEEDEIKIKGHVCPCAHFTDMPEYGTVEHDAIDWAYTHEPYQVTAGTSDTTFSPDMIVTRAQAMVFLWAAAGKPEPTSSVNKFSDVPKDSWYTKAVLWAVENGITAGTGDGLFSPTKQCSRSEILTFLWAAQNKPEPTIENPYSDVGSNWYAKPALWAYEKGMEKGEDGAFNATTLCTRQSIVLYLYRYFTGKGLAE